MAKNQKTASNGTDENNGFTAVENNEGWTRQDDTFEQHDFERHGTIEGYYTGTRHIKPADENKEEFDILTFVTSDGRRISTPANHQLKKTLDKCTDMPGTLYRIRLIGSVPVDKGNMKQFEVLSKKADKPLDASFFIKE